jgi:Flp pilus assembly protein CpaB
LILVAAVLIGIVAAFGLYQYVQKVEEDAKPNPVTVYVIKDPITRGTAFGSARPSIVEKTIPAEFRPDTYVTNLAELENKVAITDLAANQVLVHNMFVDPKTATTSFRDRLENKDLVAIAVPVDGVRGLTGYLQGGDYVNIMVTKGGDEGVTVADQPTGGQAGQAGVVSEQIPYTKSARYLFQKVKVLAVGASVEPRPGEAVEEADGTEAPQLGGSIVLLVPSDVAQKIASVRPNDLYFTLIPDSWEIKPLPAISQAELDGGPLPAEAGAQTYAYTDN